MANQQANVEMYENQALVLVVFRYLGDKRHDYPRSVGTPHSNDCRLPVWSSTLPMLVPGKFYVQLRKTVPARTAGKTSYVILKTAPLQENVTPMHVSDRFYRESKAREAAKLFPIEDPMFHLSLAVYLDIPFPPDFHELKGHTRSTWRSTYVLLTRNEPIGMTGEQIKDWFMDMVAPPESEPETIDEFYLFIPSKNLQAMCPRV